MVLAQNGDARLGHNQAWKQRWPLTPWTDELTEQAITLWNDGFSASEIAGELGGGISRNAVIGKMHRLGQAKGERPASTKPKPKRKVERRKESFVLIVAPERKAPRLSLSTFVPPLEHVTLAELDMAADCRFPIGTPTPGRPQQFCAAPREYCGENGVPHRYCGAHARLCFTWASPRR